MNRNPFRASNPLRKFRPAGMGVVRMVAGMPGMAASYPAVPAMWPSREVRRAIQKGRESRLPGAWREALVVHEGLRAAIQKAV